VKALFETLDWLETAVANPLSDGAREITEGDLRAACRRCCDSTVGLSPAFQVQSAAGSRLSEPLGLIRREAFIKLPGLAENVFSTSTM